MWVSGVKGSRFFVAIGGLRANMADPKALVTLGVSAKTKAVALMVFAPSQAEAEDAYRKAAKLLGEEDDGVLELDDAKAVALKKAYGISDTELEAAGGENALGGLIVERGALLSLRR